MNYLENNMITWWLFTATKEGCRAFVDVMHDVSQSYPIGSPEYELVEFLRDLAWRKGQMMCAIDNDKQSFERNQAAQLLDAQKTFVGDL